MYKNIISNLMDIIIVLDLKGNFLYVSPQIYTISGFKQEELLSKSGFKFMQPDDIKKAVDVLKEAIKRGNIVYIEYRTIYKKGHYIDVAANGRIVNMEGEDRTIEIGSEIKNKTIIVSIKDSGIRLNKEEKVRLFTQFGKIERYGQGLDIISDGSDLGLYISKKIVDLHEGKIWVESEGRNKGSTFYFSLPIMT